MNILLSKFNTPFETVPFDKIKSEDYLPALKEAIASAKKRIEDIKKNPSPADFSNVIEALEGASVEVDLISSVFFNLHSAETNEDLQKLAKEISPLLTEFGNDISMDLELFSKIKSVWDKKEKFNLASKNFEGRGTIIKSIDIGNKFLNISMRSDYTDMTPIDERREILIDEILNNQDKKDIK